MLTFFVFLGVLSLLIGGAILLGMSLFVRLSRWAKAYHEIAKRYSATVSFSAGRPRMTFNYGDTFCQLKNIGARQTDHRRTQVVLKWPERKSKLFVSSLGQPVGILTNWNLNPVSLDSELEADFLVYGNSEEAVRTLVNRTTVWQIQQLINHANSSGVEIFLANGKLKISKPGYLKDEQVVDDFLRFSLELFDQFRLAVNQDIEFVAEDEAVILEDVICPICSDRILPELLVTCVRCKTPHCADCWEYNGQCATFACNEKRCFRSGSGEVASAE